MKILVKNKMVSWGGNSTVTDENGKELFKVKGKVLTFRNTKKIYDLNGNLLYIVRNKFFHFFTRAAFIYSAEKQKLAKLKNRAFKNGYDVLGYGDEISIDGWLVEGCTIFKNGEAIGTVSGKILALSDTYQVEVNDSEDIPFIVAMIIAMDNVNDKSRGRA